jgi:hypothetical protein
MGIGFPERVSSMPSPAIRLRLVICLLPIPSTGMFAATDDEATSGAVAVPFDHAEPEADTFTLQYELGRRHDPGKPTVIVVADGSIGNARRWSAPRWTAISTRSSNMPRTTR